MNNTIDHFMWGYQFYFRISHETVTKSLFQLLDERFIPEVFLVGILVEEREGIYPACVEPEKDFWAKSNAFDSALALAEGIRDSYPEGKILQSHPLAQERQELWLRQRSVKDAIQSIIEADACSPTELTHFVAHPTKVGDYLVSVVLGLQTAILREHPTLEKNSVPLHEYRSFEVPTSLIDAVTRAYLDKASGNLRLPDPGSNFSEINPEEILREGAHRLMKGLAFRADQSVVMGWHSFFDSCVNIARSYYEGAAGEGTMVLACWDHVSLEKVVLFKIPVKLRVTRAARKLLQLASLELALHSNSEDLFGLVKVKMYETANENLFRVRFLDHHHWQVLHEEQVLMGVRHGKPYLTKPPFDEDMFKRKLADIFHKITDKQVQRILALVHQAEKESHGTILVFSTNAKREAERLASQATPINPKTLTPELLRNLTPIDGAVLLNPKGTCYAVGVILDGMASEEGSSARGARYNSAIRYVSSNKFPCLAVIVSEDGGIDFYP